MKRFAPLTFAIWICSLPATAQEITCPARKDEPGLVGRLQEKIVRLLEADLDWGKAFPQDSKEKAKLVQAESRAN